MLVNCPTCRATIDVAALDPGSTASCPYCQGLFQVPAAPAAAALADTVIVHEQSPPLGERDATPGEPSSKVGLIVLLLAAFALIGAGSGYLVVRLSQSPENIPNAAAKRAEAAAAEDDRVASWRTLGHWRGAGQQRTPAFRTTSSKLRLLWNAKPRDPQNADNFAIHLIDGGGRQLHTPVSIVGAGGDTAYVGARPGRYMLEILAFDTDWEVTVEAPE